MRSLVDYDNSAYIGSIIGPEIDGAAERAVRSGARPPLRYVGAGAYGIVFCDGTGAAYKVGRKRTKAYDDGTCRSVAAEAKWFAFAGMLPDLAQHVARVSHFDFENCVLVRECVEARSTPSYDRGKSDRRRFNLFERMRSRMRLFGFRSPEYKEDSFVVHPKRGLVLVDAGFGKRDLGWSNARRAVELLGGAPPVDEYEVRDVIYGLTMDAGEDLPAPKANELANRLSDAFAVRNASYVSRLSKHYGVTGSEALGGFLLPDGMFLDFSEGSGARSQDHRNIVWASVVAEKERETRYDVMARMCQRAGLIRWIPESWAVEMWRMPTQEQLDVLMRLSAASPLIVEAHRGKRTFYREFFPSNRMSAPSQIVKFYR